VHRHLNWLTAAVYEIGYRAAIRDLAARHAELDAAWRPIGRRSYQQQIAARVAEMEGHARRVRAELDRRAAQAPAADWPPVAEPGAGR
jgi:hypothetical protein